MKRYNALVIGIGILLMLSNVGCICTPDYRSFNCADRGTEYYGGSGCGIGYNTADYNAECGTGCETETCNSCESPVPYQASQCGVVPFGNVLCVSSCGGNLHNLATGTCLVGRGVLDVAAAPFHLVGNLLSHNYGCLDRLSYGYGAYSPGVYASSAEACTSVSCSACGRTSGTVIDDGTVIEDESVQTPKIQTPIRTQPIQTQQMSGKQTTSMLPPPTQKVIQTGYIQPKIKFGKPQMP
ncbi:MAG: hypothetical protein LBT46_12680 [Planctomycetaceae bacterium]|jgi:hypothetical protein|nr:hypothetical protein [Planctomycetaceae bacterium]